MPFVSQRTNLKLGDAEYKEAFFILSRKVQAICRVDPLDADGLHDARTAIQLGVIELQPAKSQEVCLLAEQFHLRFKFFLEWSTKRKMQDFTSAQDNNTATPAENPRAVGPCGI